MSEGIPKLSRVEESQLGVSVRSSEFLSRDEWERLRSRLVERSLAANPLLDDPTMTAYTPGETEHLLNRSEVRRWHHAMCEFVVPDEYETLALVPCAKSKPWGVEHTRRSSLYKGYHKVKELSDNGDIPPTYFVTISEPLGIVPQERWSDFLQYDNPGLFRDDFLRTGMVKTDWVEQFGDRKYLPFDEQIYQRCIIELGRIASRFLKNHSDRRILSFVDTVGSQSTHQEMIDVAISEMDSRLTIERYLKRDKARTEPTDYILSKIISR